MDADYVDWCYTPIIQSGGVYDLKPSAQSNADKLHGGTILCSLGVRYKNYCSNVGRTYLIDPTKVCCSWCVSTRLLMTKTLIHTRTRPPQKQQANYEFLLEVEKHVLAQLKDGAIAKDIYSSTVAYVTEKRPDLAPHLTLKNVGFVTGIEFRESAFVLGGKCTRELFKGMTVNVAVGFAGLVNEEVKEGGKGRTYALMVQDTCVVGETGASVMTGDASREFSEISFFFKVYMVCSERVRPFTCKHRPTHTHRATRMLKKLATPTRTRLKRSNPHAPPSSTPRVVPRLAIMR